MAKLGRSLLVLTAIGAAAAGTYYYLKKKDEEVPANMEDDDFDNFGEEGEPPFIEYAFKYTKRNYCC